MSGARGSRHFTIGVLGVALAELAVGPGASPLAAAGRGLHPPPPTTPIWRPAARDRCRARLESARAALLEAGFDPNRDTAEWLHVTDEGPALKLWIYSIFTPDGDGEQHYIALVAPARTHGTALSPWRARWRATTDAFGEGGFTQRVRRRWGNALVAVIDTVTVDLGARDGDEDPTAALFVRVVRPALEACLRDVDA